SMITLDVSSTGYVFAKCQVTDYHSRREALSDFNVLDFFVNTYEVDVGSGASMQNEDGEESDLGRGPGRPRNARVHYLDRHLKAKQKMRIVRSRGHKNLPNFVGRYFPQADDPMVYPFY